MQTGPFSDNPYTIKEDKHPIRSADVTIRTEASLEFEIEGLEMLFVIISDTKSRIVYDQMESMTLQHES